MLKKEGLLSYFPKITSKRYHELLTAFFNLENVWQTEFNDLKTLNWKHELIHEFLTWRKNLDIEKIEKELEKENIYCLTINEEKYPTLLKEIYDPPLCLFIKGNLDINNDFNLAVVGTRKFTSYGQQVTEEIVGALASQGITIISGLALGIDSIAHHTTLKNSGKTIAVLGSSVNEYSIYPSANRFLAKKIIETGGAIISEYPPGTVIDRYSFPKRNRIVAGLSLGTLVIEAGEKSGALITAECALENGREVFSIPQNINSPTSTGTNNLIKMGAKLVTDSHDILDALNLHNAKQYVTNKAIIPDTPTEAEILKVLSKEPTHIDQIIKLTKLPSQIANSNLSLMEMKGKVRNLGGMMYVLGR